MGGRGVDAKNVVDLRYVNMGIAKTDASPVKGRRYALMANVGAIAPSAEACGYVSMVEGRRGVLTAAEVRSACTGGGALSVASVSVRVYAGICGGRTCARSAHEESM